MPHNEGTVLMEELALQGLGQEVRMHLGCRTVHDPKVALVDLIMDEEESDIQSTCTFSGTALPVFGENDTGLVVLIDNIVVDMDTLSFEKQFRPED